jgi:thioesterase domain-containing protein
MKSPCQFIYLPGADNNPQVLAAFARGLDDYSFLYVGYPGWRRYAARDFTFEQLAHELAIEINERVPSGPIRIVGCSIGGHLGYAAALHLQSMGRKVIALCTIDSYITPQKRLVESNGSRKPGVLNRVFDLLRAGNLSDLSIFIETRFLRALFRSGGRYLIKAGSYIPRRNHVTDSTLLQYEWSMHLLLQRMRPWSAKVNHSPVALHIPVAALRTSMSAIDDETWRQRCPEITFHEILGFHDDLLTPEFIAGVRDCFANSAQRFC